MTDMNIESPGSPNGSSGLVDPFDDGVTDLPQTPAAKETRTLWHGLLSPITPSTSFPEGARVEATDDSLSYRTDSTDSPALDGRSPTRSNQHCPLDFSEAAEILQSLSYDADSNDESSQQKSSLSKSPEPSIETPVKSRIYTRHIGRDQSPEPATLRRSARVVEKKKATQGMCFSERYQCSY